MTSRSGPQASSFALVWGIAGITLLLGSALYRLTPLALEPIYTGMNALQTALYAIWVVFNGYAEGYRGFQRQFAPRVVARGQWLARHPRPLLVVLAPLFCMGLIGATRKRLIISWVLLGGITLLVAAVRQLDQPWRGIVDGGVVVGLSWGLAAMLVFFARAVAGHDIDMDPEVSEALASDGV